MAKPPFNKEALLEKLKIENTDEITYIKLINENVKILISILGKPPVIYLDGFYKQSNERGIARCALYVLLKNYWLKVKFKNNKLCKLVLPLPTMEIWKD